MASKLASDGALLQGLALALFTCWVPAMVAAAYVVRVQVAAAPDQLRVTGVVSVRNLAWDRVVGARAGYYGVTIFLSDGSAVVASAVQKSNAAKWLKQRTRADDVADEISRRARGSC
jgi:hypothetical protein